MFPISFLNIHTQQEPWRLRVRTHLFVAWNQDTSLCCMYPCTSCQMSTLPRKQSLWHFLLQEEPLVSCGQTGLGLCLRAQLSVPQFAHMPDGTVPLSYLHKGILGTNYCKQITLIIIIINSLSDPQSERWSLNFASLPSSCPRPKLIP